ncbi:MAG TPA: peptidoglycan DD-metalloendopeptidase family protein [Propionibacteriaceae bacterium]
MTSAVSARTLFTVVVASAVGITLAAPAAADDLNRQRERVTAQLAASQQDLGESTQELRNAAVAVVSAQDALDTAQDQLAATREKLAVAKARDLAMAAKLAEARRKLVLAKAAVVAGQRRLDAEKALAATMVRQDYQQQTNLLPLAVLLSDQSTAHLQTRMQWSTTMMDTTAAQISRLAVLQQALTRERARQAALEQQIELDRVAAASSLSRTQALERQAVRETAGVARLVRQRAAVRAAAAVAVASDQRQVAQLSRERVSVEQRIMARIAKAKAEALRRAAVARAARLAALRAAAAERVQQLAAAKRASKAAAAQRKRVAAQEKADQKSGAKKQSTTKKRGAKKSTPKYVAKKVKKANKSKAKKKSSSGSGSSGSHGFTYPVNGPITSPYGRRFHPILHVWKLHDGTDFGAGCGTPIRAAYSGRVAERYYSGGYGNRLMIDHGVVDGRYVTTGYNHAQRYTVSVGEQVSRGEVIGYVGSTGYSTGCHLHLMLWLGGSRVNPMSWY